MKMTIHTLASLLLLLPVAAIAQTSADPSGHWEGAVQSPEAAISIEVDLQKEDRELVGTVSVPPQNLKGFPLVIEGVEGRSLSFRFRGAPGNRLFQGTVSEDGQSITGQFTQSGFSMPFTLTRKGEPRIDAPVKSAPIPEELEGPWSATLEARHQNGIQQRIILTLANQPDGTSTGTIINPGDGLEIPIASITRAASRVTLDLKAISGSYSGTVNADGTEMVGTFIQGTAVLPLTFRRSSAAEKPK
jgi:hypothetical protein